jgi:hypothetical protein
VQRLFSGTDVSLYPPPGSLPRIGSTASTRSWGRWSSWGRWPRASWPSG